MPAISKVKYSITILLLSFGFCSVFSQNQEVLINYDEVYRFPVSIGVEAQFVSPLSMFGTDYQGDFSIVDISALGRFPLAKIPELQPLTRLGLVLTSAKYDAANPDLDKFDNTRIYVTGGLGYLHKFNKQFEIGADLEAGIGYSMFPKIDPVGTETYGAWNFQTGLGGRIVFNPSYNFSLNIHPVIGYSRSFSPLERFNGFTISIGISADYRIGTDPDDPRADIRSIQFQNPWMNDIFAAMQSYYKNNPVGGVTLTNTEKYPITDVKLSFYQPGYMNIATAASFIGDLQPGESVDVQYSASYDQSVFGLEGVTPLTGEIRVDYTLRTRNGTQTIPVHYDLYDKNSLTWDDDRKVAAFITSGDSALANYLSYLKQVCKDVTNPGYSDALQTAMQVFYGLTEIGCLYQRDPTLSTKMPKAMCSSLIRLIFRERL